MHIDFTQIELQQLVIHRVGNKHRAERNFISDHLYSLDESITEVLLRYFLKPFRKADETYQFRHSAALNYNEVYGFAKNIFETPDQLLSESEHILQHLYRQSEHPNIKSGELYVAYFDGLLYGDELVTAIGIFKSEQKNPFLQVLEKEGRLVLRQREGIYVDKLDKGCLIINTEQEDGYRVLSVDNNQYDASYWLYNFLDVDFVRDENYHTRSYLELCNEFSKEVIIPAYDKKEQMKFLSNSVDYFNTNDSFNFDNFTDQVVPNQEMANEFRSYQQNFALDDVDHFAISKQALRSAKRKFKNRIKLDTNIQIQLDINNPESSNRFIEKGYDEARGMHFYKVYFNEELE